MPATQWFEKVPAGTPGSFYTSVSTYGYLLETDYAHVLGEDVPSGGSGGFASYPIMVRPDGAWSSGVTRVLWLEVLPPFNTLTFPRVWCPSPIPYGWRMTAPSRVEPDRPTTSIFRYVEVVYSESINWNTKLGFVSFSSFSTHAGGYNTGALTTPYEDKVDPSGKPYRTLTRVFIGPMSVTLEVNEEASPGQMLSDGFEIRCAFNELAA